jgi:hypothetical protein
LADLNFAGQRKVAGRGWTTGTTRKTSHLPGSHIGLSEQVAKGFAAEKSNKFIGLPTIRSSLSRKRKNKHHLAEIAQYLPIVARGVTLCEERCARCR